MLHRMEAVEHIGSGIKRIRNLCREYGVAEPRIEVSEHWFTMIFPRPELQTDRAHVATQAESQPESRPELQPESLAIRILILLKDNPLSKSDLSARLGQKSVSGQLNKVIRQLLTEEYVELTIPDKPASRLQKYRITLKGQELHEKRDR
jgi:ATP-dependent DNA helicase RecG